VTALIGSQLASLAENLPEYRYNIIEKIQSFRQATAGNGLIGSISKTMDELKNELLKPPEQRPVKPSGRPAGPSFASVYPQRNPIPVEVFPPAETPAEVIEAVVGPMLGPLAMAGIIVVFVIFFLLQREDLRDRFIRLVGSRDLNRTTQALDDTAARFQPPSVLCIGGRSALDEAVASMLAQILDSEGIGARVVSAAEVAPAGIARFSPAGARIVCLSYLDAGASPNARYLIRRLRRVMPFQSVILCLWSFPDDEAVLRDATQKTNSSAVVKSLGAAVSAVKDLLSRDTQERPAASGATVHVLLPSAPDKR
jgi:hypothetical protein